MVPPAWALVLRISGSPEDAPTPDEALETVPVTAPAASPVTAPVAVPVAPPMSPVWVGPPDLQALDRQFGAFYPGPKGKGLRVGGALAIAFGGLQLFTALLCLGTAAGVHDSGDVDTGRTLGLIAAGFGISGLLHTGAGVPMLVVGRMRMRRYHAWLLGQPRAGAAPRVSLRPGATSTRAWGLTLALRF